MTDAKIAINPDGSGSVDLDGATTPISASSVTDARQQATQLIAQRAATLGQPLSVTATEGGREWPLLIAPDGSISSRPVTVAQPLGASAPAPSRTEHRVTEIPDSQIEPDTDATRPRAVSSNSSASWASGGNPVPPTTDPGLPHTDSTSIESADLTDQPVPATVASRATAEQPAQLDPVETDPRWTELSREPAEQGYRGTLNGMGLKLSPTEDELAQRREALRQQLAREEQERLADEQHAQEQARSESRRATREREAADKDKAERTRIQTTYSEPKTIAFMNEKGGVGKTTDTYCIGATFGRIRGGDVIAWDANETRGTLGFRAQKGSHTRSVVDLLEEAAEDFTTVQGSKRATLTRYTRGQGDNLFGVVASDESRDRQDLVDADAFAKVHEILARFYSLILIDTGNNHRVSHFTAALEATDQLVIPVSAGADGAYAAEVMLDNFTSLGYADLVQNAVVLLHDSATRRGDAGAIAQRFESRVRTIVPIPFDPALDTGDEIDYEALQPATRTAYQEAAASIAEGLVGPQQG